MTRPALRLLLAFALLAAALAGAARAQGADDGFAERVRALVAAQTPSSAAGGLAVERFEVEVGRLDPRLKLAPCARIEPHLAPGARLWGASRVGLRCADGPVRWNVWLPVRVRAFGRALAAARPLAAGSTLAAGDLAEAEVDLAAENSSALVDAEAIAGRVLARDLAAGDALRESHLKARQWFAAGEPVRVVAGGVGWRVTGDAVALEPGLEGRSVRVRTEAGRVVAGRAVAPRTIELPL